MKKRIILSGIVATVLATAGFVTIGALPASAAYQCQDNQVCFYEKANYTGTVYVPGEMSNNSGQVDQFLIRWFSNGTNVDNRVTSIVNNTGWCVVVYRGPYFRDDNGVESGWLIRPDRGENLWGTDYDNRISSARFHWRQEGCP